MQAPIVVFLVKKESSGIHDYGKVIASVFWPRRAVSSMKSKLKDSCCLHVSDLYDSVRCTRYRIFSVKPSWAVRRISPLRGDSGEISA